MILIFTSKKDLIVNKVLEELILMHQGYIRINEDTKITFEINVQNQEKTILIINGKSLHFRDISSIWIRKGIFFRSLAPKTNEIYEFEFITRELNIFLDYFDFKFKSKIKLNTLDQKNLNKLKVLEIATSVGLTVPSSFIVNSKYSLNELFKVYNKLVTKPLSDIINPKSNISMLTRIITLKDTENIAEIFYPSLVQEYIVSIYEIRVVYLLGKCYSAIIYPKFRSEIEPDFRGTSNSEIGFFKHSLDMNYAKLISKLMDSLKLEFCSIDVLVDKSNNYYIIDVNPFGQFGMVSNLYNNQIEKRIAQALIPKKIIQNEE